MKAILSILFFAFFTNSIFCQQSLNLMSFNIRLNLASDSLNAWPLRKDLVASQVLFHQVHVLGVQEALHEQMIDLKQRLPGFHFAGVGRKDGATAGEYSAIFYDSSRLQLLQTNTFWLSQTPSIPGSKSWDAAIERIVTWGKFHDRINRDTLFVFNTHFDHIGSEARRQSALLLMQQIQILAKDKPVVLTGDFNARPGEPPILAITDTSQPFSLINSAKISLTRPYGPTGTFNAFRSMENSDEPIDFIFVSRHFSVQRHGTISQTWKGRFASDHFAVFAELIINK